MFFRRSVKIVFFSKGLKFSKFKIQKEYFHEDKIFLFGKRKKENVMSRRKSDKETKRWEDCNHRIKVEGTLY